MGRFSYKTHHPLQELCNQVHLTPNDCSSLTEMKRKYRDWNTTDISKNSTLYSTSASFLNNCFESYKTNRSNPPSVHRSSFGIRKHRENIMESRSIFSKPDDEYETTSKFSKGESQPLTGCGCVHLAKSVLRDSAKGAKTLKNSVNCFEVMTDGSPITKAREQKGSENNKKMDVTNFSHFLRPVVNLSGSRLRAPALPAAINEELKVSTSHGSCLLVESTMINCTSGQPSLLAAPIDANINSPPDQKSNVVGPLAEPSKFSQGSSNNPNITATRNYQRTTDQSEYQSNGDDQYENVNKSAPAREKTGVKRKRIAKKGSLSEKKRRHEINKRLRTLQELLPNCRKVNKISVLDEAIEYLKTLQLQLRMMSVSAGPGPYTPLPVMLPPGLMQQLHTRSLVTYPTIDPVRAMRMGMGAGCSSALQFPTPPISGAVERINLQMLGVPSSVSPVPMTTLPHLVHSLTRFSAQSMADTTENISNPVDMGSNVP